MSFLKNSAPMVHKIVDSKAQNAENESRLEKMEKKFEDMDSLLKKYLNAPFRNDIEGNVSSPRSPQHQDNNDKGRKCEVYGAWNTLVAYGTVVEVDPDKQVHNVAMGNGNYKIHIDSAVDKVALLYKPNSQATVIDDVVGSFTVWPK